MNNFKPKIKHHYHDHRYEITAICPDCGKELLNFKNVVAEELKNRKDTMKDIKGCLHCNLQHTNMCQGVARTISKRAMIMSLSKY